MTMEEYIKLEEEKAHRHGRVFNWETATYGKIRVDDDLYDLRSVEAEFPAIVIDNAFAPQDALPCKSQVNTSVNDEIDFRISFDESNDVDYAIIYDKNSFSYKMISFNNLKTDSENDNEKAGIHSFLPPKPTISYVDDLDFFKDFKNEFPAIVYNDAQTSKSNYLTKQTLSPQHNNESNLNDETSLFKYDEVGQNVLYFNDLFLFNVIHLDDLKSDKDNDNNEIDIIQSSEVRMKKVIKGEFEKIKDVKVEYVSLTCDTSLKVFNNEVNRLSGMDDDLFTYEVDVANIPCDSKMDDDSKHEADDDMGYDSSDVAFTEWLGLKGDDEVELTHEESSDDKDEVAEVFKIDTNLFNFETPMCKAFKFFNYLLQINPDLLTKDIEGFKTYEDYRND
ncbi:hypothetical protein Tco_1140571 [Tanacetum coccineum]